MRLGLAGSGFPEPRCGAELVNRSSAKAIRRADAPWIRAAGRRQGGILRFVATRPRVAKRQQASTRGTPVPCTRSHGAAAVPVLRSVAAQIRRLSDAFGGADIRNGAPQAGWKTGYKVPIDIILLSGNDNTTSKKRAKILAIEPETGVLLRRIGMTLADQNRQIV